MIDLNLIQTFVEAARMENLSLVARKLSISQSAVSQRIGVLEAQVGRTLFLRKKSGIELNRFGRTFYDLCSSFDKNIDNISNWIMSQRAEITGDITISTVYTMLNCVFPEFLKMFLKKYSGVTVRLIDANISANVEDDVMSGNADLGIIIGDCQIPSLKMQMLFSGNEVLMVCAPDHPLAKHNKKITKEDLKKSRLIWHYNKRSRCLKLICKKLGISPLHEMNNILLPDMNICKSHALEGLGVAFLARMCIYDELKTGRLVALPGFTLSRMAHLISRNEKYESPLVTAFKKEFTQYCKVLDKKWLN